MKNQLECLPDTMITAVGPISQKCLDHKLNQFLEVCAYVRDLPYGELEDKTRWVDTLKIGKGSSCTKHAFLKALSDEVGIQLDLILGVYSMTDQNTPGVGVILNKYRMQSIPEAHCYLRYQGQRIDLTRYYYDIDFIEPINTFIYWGFIKIFICFNIGLVFFFVFFN